MASVAVILPVYNHARYVADAVESLLAQDYTDFEIVAVDDGSTDSSLEILERYKSRLRILHSPHRGPAAARNRALSATDCPYVAFMDADDLCAPNRLSLEVATLQREDVDLVASALSFVDADGRVLPGEWRCPVRGRKDYWGALLERNWIGTPSVVMRRSVLDSCGVFDEQFTHAEDYDLWLRIGAAFRLAYVDKPLIQCRRHQANTSIDIESHQHFERLALQKVDLAKARGSLERLYASETGFDEAWLWFLLRSGSEHFVGEMESALSRDPESQGLRFAAGVHQYDCGNWKEALSTFSRLQGNDPAARNNAGVLLARMGNTADAALHFQEALRLRPDYNDASLNMAALRGAGTMRLTRRPFRASLVPMAAAQSREGKA